MVYSQDYPKEAKSNEWWLICDESLGKRSFSHSFENLDLFYSHILTHVFQHFYIKELVGSE